MPFRTVVPAILMVRQVFSEKMIIYQREYTQKVCEMGHTRATLLKKIDIIALFIYTIKKRDETLKRLGLLSIKSTILKREFQFNPFLK